MANFKELKGRVKGVVVVMTTPFREDYSVDEEGVRKLTRFLLDSGLREGNGVLVLAGSTGAVSYTHLDVYKRQVYFWRLSIGSPPTQAQPKT